MSKEIAVDNKESSEVSEVKITLPAVAEEMLFSEEDSGAGFEGTSVESFAIPFIQILQKGTPMVDEDNPHYVEGAKAGHLFNSVTRQIYNGKEGIDIIPCAFQRTFIRWGGRDSANPGFKGVLQVEEIDRLKHDPAQIKEVEGRLYVPNADGTVDTKKNDYYADTRSHFVLIIDPESGDFSRALFPLTSSQVKASKTLLTLLHEKIIKRTDGKRINPPTFANLVHVNTKPLTDNKGNSWSGVEFTPTRILGIEDRDLYEAAKQFNRDVVSDAVPVDYAKADYNNGGADDTEGGESFSKPKEAKTF
jgi:hypothetical protein